jgi:hypothetical protein
MYVNFGRGEGPGPTRLRPRPAKHQCLQVAKRYRDDRFLDLLGRRGLGLQRVGTSARAVGLHCTAVAL